MTARRVLAAAACSVIGIAFAMNWWAAFGEGPPAEAENPARLAATDDIREAVFRYQFEHNASGLQKKAACYFLEIDRKDPAAEFLKRFEGHTPPVKPASACVRSAAEGVKDKETGGRGLVFRQATIRWINDNEVEVEGGYYEGGLSASGNTYKAGRKDGKWVVASDKMHWIS